MCGFPTVTRWTVVLLAIAHGHAQIKIEVPKSASNQTAKTKTRPVKDVYNSTAMPSNCQDAMNLNPMRGSGVYTINLPNSGLKPFRVYCLEDPLYKMPWTLIQRRVNADVDFFRRWQDYKVGFGDLYSNFWLGLEKMHALTSQPNNTHELWIQMTEVYTADARYSRFVVGDEYSKYMLKDLGSFVGIRGDGLSRHKGHKFSTYDFDNDASDINCAQKSHGGNWYFNCDDSNLNGIYGSASQIDGIHWDPWQDHGVLVYCHMAIRPAEH